MECSSLEVVKVTMLPDGRMNTRNAARYLGVKEKTLAQQRFQGRGPRYVKPGRVFYYKEDLDAWLKRTGRTPGKARGG